MRAIVVLCAVASALAASRASAQECAGGRVASPATDWHCCWPAQTWGAAERACVGPPSCPPGTVAHGENCVGAQAVQVAPVVVRPPVGPAPLAPIAPRAPIGAQPIAPIGVQPIAPIGVQPVAPIGVQPALPIGVQAIPAAVAVDVRSVPMGAPEWLSSPTAPTPDSNPRYETHELNPGFLVPGIIFLGVGYVTAVISGSVILGGTTSTLAGGVGQRGNSFSPTDNTCHDVVGGLALIPVVGALLALVAMTCTVPGVAEVWDYTREPRRLVGYRASGSGHGFPDGGHAGVLVPSAVFQILGLGFVIGGIVQGHQAFVVDESADLRLEILPGAAFSDAGLTLRARF